MHRQSKSPTAGPVQLDRRTLLAGAAGLGFLAACGSGDESQPEYSLVQRFPQTALVPGEVRLPHGLFLDAAFVNDGPESLGAQVVDADGNAVGERMTAPRFDVTPSSYYVWRPTIAEPGLYALIVDGGPVEGASFQVFEPGQVAVPKPGEVLAGFDTPTIVEPADVDPICTRDPICPFHAVTLTEALSDGRAVAYMVGTPAFCQTGTCAPALESLVAIAPEFDDDVVFVHAEVFTDLTASTITPAVEAARLDFEPALFITDKAGVIVERIDAIWGPEELRERLTAATSQ